LSPKDQSIQNGTKGQPTGLQCVLRIRLLLTAAFLLVIGTIGSQFAYSSARDISQFRPPGREERYASAKNQTQPLDSEAANEAKAGMVLLEQQDWPGAQKNQTLSRHIMD